jgi:1-acyl-sn-glycerol-3-phosphate acyltransferase
MLIYYLALPLFFLNTIFCTIVGVFAMLVDRSGGLYHKAFRFWSRSTLWLFRIRASVTGTEHLEPGATYIYLPNHSSYLDIPVLGATIPEKFRFILKEELTKVPIWGWALRTSPHIIIRRTDARNAMAGIEQAASDIASGASVVIFPEGTRTHDGALAPFKRGGFALATRSGVPLVPIAIRGTYPLLSRDSRRVLPGSVSVTVGRPIPNAPGGDRNQEREVQAEARRQLEEMLRN